MKTRDEAVQFVVTAPRGERARPLAQTLTDFEGLRVVDVLDDWTVLVVSDLATIERVEKEQPELVVEPNIAYSKASSPR